MPWDRSKAGSTNIPLHNSNVLCIHWQYQECFYATQTLKSAFDRCGYASCKNQYLQPPQADSCTPQPHVLNCKMLMQWNIHGQYMSRLFIRKAKKHQGKWKVIDTKHLCRTTECLCILCIPCDVQSIQQQTSWAHVGHEAGVCTMQSVMHTIHSTPRTAWSPSCVMYSVRAVLHMLLCAVVDIWDAHTKVLSMVCKMLSTYSYNVHHGQQRISNMPTRPNTNTNTGTFNSHFETCLFFNPSFSFQMSSKCIQNIHCFLPATVCLHNNCHTTLIQGTLILLVPPPDAQSAQT
jgi:hypothetical protein